ncbi:hypothetical protein MCOR25_011268 [Pyricularia grisea]|nr:hypothetical protein MCOR25_011268 [Pyricularia grisea]
MQSFSNCTHTALETISSNLYTCVWQTCGQLFLPRSSHSPSSCLSSPWLGSGLWVSWQEPLRNIDARRGSFRLFCCVRYCSIGVGFWGRAVACVRCLDKGTGSKCSNWQAI